MESDDLLAATDAYLDEVDALIAETVAEQEALKPFAIGKLKLSDAIRGGAQLQAQSYTSWQEDSGATCAIGAAIDYLVDKGLLRL
jgi:hypothetical protein